MKEERFRYQHVEHYILQMVENRTISVDGKLPSLRQLSQRLQVSISTVSQAYVELERRGIIQARDRSGFYLLPTQPQLPEPQGPAILDLQPRMSNRHQLTREVLDTLGQHDLLPLGVICPDASLLPAKMLTRLMTQQLRANDAEGIAYSGISGDTYLRQQIALHALSIGIQVNADEVIITCGAMEAVFIALRTLTRPGDTVVIASPVYHCFLQLLENCGLRAVELPSDPQRGICPGQLEKILQRHEVKACILAANFNNPDGSQLDDASKQQVVELLANYDVPLVEDDVGGDLHFTDHRPTTLKQFDRHNGVIHCNSFSKTLAPGYRLGWMLPGRYYNKALEVKYTTNVCCATPTQKAVAAYLDGGYYTRQLRTLRHALQQQMRTMQLELSRHFPIGTKVTRPGGGGVLWLELPDSVDATEYFYRARENGIGIAPGPIFTTQEKYANFIRISCNGVWDDRLAQGVALLGRLAHEMVKI